MVLRWKLEGILSIIDNMLSRVDDGLTSACRLCVFADMMISTTLLQALHYAKRNATVSDPNPSQSIPNLPTNRS